MNSCSVCGKEKDLCIAYTYELRLDPICMSCLSWLDCYMIKFGAKKYSMGRKNNPNIIYYFDRSPKEIKDKKDFIYYGTTFTCFLP